MTGADDIFVVDRRIVQKSDQSLFADYLPDRKIERYRIPGKLNQAVFYPFEDGKPLSENDLSLRFPSTWKYLNDNREKLEARRSVQTNEAPWWRPVRPRDPSNMLRPKIVCPHLMLTPRFGLDLKGTVAISHSPFFITETNEEEALLKFFCAVLNSTVCHWFMQTHSPKYGRGYNRVEVSLMKMVPVPDPSTVSDIDLRELLSLVDEALKHGTSSTLDAKIDDIVATMYGMSKSEKDELLGVG